MKTGAVTLTEFLLARIDEDETAVSEYQFAPPMEEPFASMKMSDLPPLMRAHLIRWNPVRVLAECEAKRRAVVQVSDVKWGGYSVRDALLPLLALPYADHPDYRQEWRP
jgi:hypothetical protein